MFKKHPRLEEMLLILKNLRDIDNTMKIANNNYKGFSKLVVPFIFMEKSVSEKKLDELWSCRIAELMSEHFVEIIHN